MSTTFATQNNVILPLEGEVFDPTRAYVTELSVAAIADMTPPVIFDDLSDRFWLEHFSDHTRAELADHARQVGVEFAPKATKPKLVSLLVMHYREMTGA